MNLSDPVQSVVPSANGCVLSVLARTEVALSGRQIAELTDGEVGRTRTAQILRDLARAGIVQVQDRPPALLYLLNREHVAAPAITALAAQREELLRRMRERLVGWNPASVAVWLFGSAARGEGDSDSDLDVLVVRPDSVAESDVVWQEQLSTFADQAWRWSGNGCEIVEVNRSELVAMSDAGERLVTELRRDSIVLAGQRVHQLVGARVRR